MSLASFPRPVTTAPAPRRRCATLALLGLLLAGCSGLRAYARPTRASLGEAFHCAVEQLRQMGYTLELVDSLGGVVQGRREITGISETARGAAAAATQVITAGLAGGRRTRFDQVTTFVYLRHYPQGSTIETIAGLLTVAGDAEEQSAPTDDAKRDARRLVDACATQRA